MLQKIPPKPIRCICLLALVIFLMSTPGLAQTVVSVSPQSLSIDSLEQTNISIHVVPDGEISGLQLSLDVDPQLVGIGDVREGPLFKQTGASTIFDMGAVDTASGNIENMYGLVIGRTTVISEGDFAVIGLRSAGVDGVCQIDIHDVIVSNPAGEEMDVIVEGGVIYIGDVSPQEDMTSDDVDESTEAAGQNSLLILLFALMVIFVGIKSYR